ncbi:MAG: phosphonate ABC transporter ATP-binding protein [Proteobacteria bacterium]|nr:phosphonate ABC transporter ATP-binding protein [Pseudomonadota bacterium]
MIEIRGLAKSYGDHQALRDVSLSIRPGEFVVVLGPSGAGKSTLLRCINRLIEPTAGDILVDGTSLSSNRRDLRLLRRNVAMIFQQHNLVKRLSVLKNVLVGRMADLSPVLSSLQLFPEADVKIALHCLEQVAMSHKARNRADALSGGEQQRVGIARALAQQPKFMLADEPVASLDPKTSRTVLNYLKKSCKDSNIAVLCNLHQIDYALEFAERVVGLSSGEVVYDGAPAGVSGDVIRSIYPGLDDPNVLDAAQRLTERRRAAAEAVIAQAAGAQASGDGRV